MMRLNYSQTIRAPRHVVWTTMLDEDSYRKWASAFSAESQYEGEWIEGREIKFFDPNLGGTIALLSEVKPHETIVAKHVAMMSKDGELDTESGMARKWIGSIETYTLTERDGLTELQVGIETHEDFRRMFEDSWPNALGVLKDLCEQS